MDTLLTRVGKVAHTTPDAVALVDCTGVHKRQQLSYAQFWNQACAFASALRAAGLQADARVAIVLPNRIEAAVAIYGTWLAGGIAVPLDVQARGADLAFRVRHCAALHLVYEAGNSELEREIGQLQHAIVAWPLGPDPWRYGDDDSCTPVASPGDPAPAAPAMILYTSGTTGAPKGVTLSHANLLASAEAVTDYLALQPTDSVLALLPFYYAYGASVLHTHLLSGARVVLAPKLTFPPVVLETTARERVTGLSGVSSTFTLLLQHLAADRYDLSALRYLTQAGGVMPTELVTRLRAVLPGPRLFLMYGQTEATSRLTWLPPERLDDKPGSVGVPVRGVRLRIVQETGNEAAIGAEGEIQVKGANVMLGYWQAAASTAAAFDGDWLRTGDIGWLDHEGFLYLCGRRDGMIKTGAHRVYPETVERAITQLPEVADALVAGADHATLGQVLNAYVVLRQQVNPEAQSSMALHIKTHCRACLAPYQVPRMITFVTSLPQTASGKLHRAAGAQLASVQPPSLDQTMGAISSAEVA